MLPLGLSPNLVDDLTEGHSWPYGVPETVLPLLSDRNRKGGKIAGIDSLEALFKRAGNENFVELIQTRNPIGEPAGVIVGADDDPGADHGIFIWKRLADDALTGDFERAVVRSRHFRRVHLAFLKLPALLVEGPFDPLCVVDADRRDERVEIRL